MRYEVKLVRGGSLQAPHLDRVFQAGITYPYGPEDQDYVEKVLKHEPRLKVTDIKGAEEDPEKQPKKAKKSDDTKDGGK